jgi:hypothetical protein
MQYKFSSIDISVCTFSGLSHSYQRIVAVAATLAIVMGLGYFGCRMLAQVANSTMADEFGIFLFCGILVHYILTGKMILQTLANSLFERTPVAVLFRHDKEIIERARQMLCGIADQIDLYQYLKYGKINPAIHSKKFLLVVARQRRGDINAWLNNIYNLKTMADFVYQIYLVERLLSEDELDQSRLMGQQLMTH